MTPPPLSVSELSSRVRHCLEGNFPLLWVSGEVSNLTRATSGHLYFSIKDESAQIRCVMFRNRAQLASWRLDNGQQVEINARVSFYEPRGDFQLNVEGMRRAGLGRLYETFARLRQQLENAGLFAPEKRQAIPAYPQCIGIVSSLRAAALQDVLVTLRRRAPNVPIIVFPTPVQGIEAAPGIATALLAAQRNHGCDVLLLVRGGGSIEDLWAFNEEATVRAIATSRIPIISGIGHETDLTLADLAADQRATTPTAAAEMVSTHWFAAKTMTRHLEQSLHMALTHPINQFRQRLDIAAAQLVHPRSRLERSRERLTHLQARLTGNVKYGLAERQHRLTQSSHQFRSRRPQLDSTTRTLERLAQRLTSGMQQSAGGHRLRLERLGQALELLSPAHTMERGYAIVRTVHGKVAMSPADIDSDQPFSVQLAHGHLRAVPIAGDIKPD